MIWEDLGGEGVAASTSATGISTVPNHHSERAEEEEEEEEECVEATRPRLFHRLIMTERLSFTSRDIFLLP